MINAYFNLVNVNLILKVRKPISKFDFMNNLDLVKKSSYIMFLNLANLAQKFASVNLLSSPFLLTILPLSINLGFLTKASTSLIFDIGVSRLVIWLRLQIKY